MRKSIVFGAPLLLGAAMLFTPVSAQQPAPSAPSAPSAAGGTQGGDQGGKSGRAGESRRGGGGAEGGKSGRVEGSGTGGGRVERRGDGDDRRGRADGRRDGGRIVVNPTVRGDGIRGHDRRYRGTRHAWGPGVGFYFYDGYYHGDCRWLRRKAVETGSRIWWQRFRQCRAHN